MQRRLRLRGQGAFEELRARGRTFQHRLLTLSYVPNQLDHNRYGFIVSKRIGKATRRNHVRRWLREALRQRDPQIGYRGNPQENAALGCNIVLIARPSLAEATYQQLQEAVDELLRRAGLLPA